MNRRILTLLALVLVAGAGLVGLTGSSSATWVATSSTTSSVRAAADWTPPTVRVEQPADPVRGTVSVTVAASDTSGIASVALQVRPVGAPSWRALCTTASAPHTCIWNTAGEPDATYELRARATDTAGYAATSAVVRTTVVNSAGVVLAHPGALLRATVPLQANLNAAADATWTVRIERTAAGGTNWQPLCTGLTTPYTCSWDTTTAANSTYDLRAVATSGTVSITSAVVSGVLVDNVAPTVSLTVPAGTLRGEVALTSTASDAHSGLASVVVQAAASATGPWTDLCTTSAAANVCRYDTTKSVYGPHHFRAVATDKAGNRTISAVVGPRLVDNTTRSVTLADPGSWLEGTVTLTATASSTAAITSVKFQRAAKGSSTWADLCTDTGAPWTCDWNTREVSDGSYDLRAVLTDANGNQATSNVVGSRSVDNTTTAFRGVDVQALNGGGTVGRVDAGDTMVFTFSRRVDLSTVTPGWTGNALDVQLEVRDAGAFSEEIMVTRPGSSLNLGSVRSTASMIAAFQTHAAFKARLVASTELVGGIPRTVVTVEVGDLVSGGVRTMLLFNSDLTWNPTAQVKAISGQTLSTVGVEESGARDRDF